MADATVSVILCVDGPAAHLGEQLAALAGQRGGAVDELVVVYGDGASVARGPVATPPSLVARHIDATGAVAAGRAALNVGVQASTGDLVLLCRPDDLVSSSWVAQLSGALSRCGAAAGWCDDRTLNGDHTLWRETWDDRTTLPRLDPLLPHHFGLANCGFRRATLDRVGGFDERVSPCEDVALAYALRGHKAQLAYNPRAVVRCRHPSQWAEHLALHERYGWGVTRAVAANQWVGLRITAQQYVQRMTHWAAGQEAEGKDPLAIARTASFLAGCRRALAGLADGGLPASHAPRPPGTGPSPAR